MDRLSRQKYFFGDYQLDLTLGYLVRDGDEVKLRPKSFALLKYLVENNGRLISKDELINAVWADTAVTDDSLVKCLKDIRRALHDDSQRIIRTVPRRGYIFAANVSENLNVGHVATVAEDTSGVQVAVEEETNETGRLAALPTVKSVPFLPKYRLAGFALFTTAIKRHRSIVIVSLVALATIATATIYLTRPGDAIDSIAVLPFVNAGNDSNTEYLSDGISDSIIERLSHLPTLKRVVPLISVLRYKGKQIDPQVVGHELNVRAVLTGRLIQRGDDLLVSAELIDVKDNKHLWGQQYELKSKDILTVQEQIAEKISENLRLKLTTEQKQRLVKPQTQNAEAFQLYLQGLYYWRKFTDETLIKSSEYFQRAIEKDPNYTLAHVGLADSYIARTFAGEMPATEAWPKAEEAAVKALAIDDTVAEVHVTLAQIKLYKYWDWPGAEQECLRSIQLSPELAKTHGLYARILDALGRFDEALDEAKRAHDIDSLTPHTNSFTPKGADVGQILYHARRYDEAIEAYRETPDLLQAYLGIGEVYVSQGKYDEAIAVMEKARPLMRRTRNLARIGTVYAAAGKKDEVIRILEQVKKETATRYDLGTHVAAIYALLGNKDEAFAWLDNAFEARNYALSDVRVNPMFDSLHSDPRFRKLLGRMGLSY